MKYAWILVTLLIAGTIAMTQQAQTQTGGGADAIRPFRVHFPDEALADTRARVVGLAC